MRAANGLGTTSVGLKYTQGFTRLWPSVATISAMVVSLLLLGLAMRQLPLGMAYAIWVGTGALGTGILGMVLFGESVSATKLVSLALIVVGITGMKLSA